MTQRRYTIVFTVILLCSFWATVAFAFTGKVVGVTDGDTLSVLHQGKAEKIRLIGIDAPEAHQGYGRVAKQFVSELAFGKIVTVEVKGRDKYGRTLADVVLPNEQSLNRALVQAGLAWWYFKYSNDVTLGHLEVEAKAGKRGLWQDGQAIPPWAFRKINRERSNRQAQAIKGSAVDRVPATTDGTLPILGNRRSQKYHRPDCRNYDDIAKKNQVPFETIKQAEDAGYTVAGNCPK